MTMRTLIHERVEQARAGTNPTVIARLRSGWAVLGDHQFFRGYSLLLPDPVVAHLTDLEEPARTQYLADMAAIGDALLTVTGAWRINYEILGNHDEALHAHLFPRYLEEPDDYRTGPVWRYTGTQRRQVPFEPIEHADLIAALRTELEINAA